MYQVLIIHPLIRIPRALDVQLWLPVETDTGLRLRRGGEFGFMVQKKKKQFFKKHFRLITT